MSPMPFDTRVAHSACVPSSGAGISSSIAQFLLGDFVSHLLKRHVAGQHSPPGTHEPLQPMQPPAFCMTLASAKTLNSCGSRTLRVVSSLAHSSEQISWIPDISSFKQHFSFCLTILLDPFLRALIHYPFLCKWNKFVLFVRIPGTRGVPGTLLCTLPQIGWSDCVKVTWLFMS